MNSEEVYTQLCGIEGALNALPEVSNVGNHLIVPVLNRLRNKIDILEGQFAELDSKKISNQARQLYCSTVSEFDLMTHVKLGQRVTISHAVVKDGILTQFVENIDLRRILSDDVSEFTFNPSIAHVIEDPRLKDYIEDGTYGCNVYCKGDNFRVASDASWTVPIEQLQRTLDLYKM